MAGISVQNNACLRIETDARNTKFYTFKRSVQMTIWITDDIIH